MVVMAALRSMKFLSTMYSSGGYACLMARAAADYREMVRNILRESRDASRGDPPNGVSTRGQGSHEEVGPLLSAWTQDQFGHRGFVKSGQIARGQLHVKDRRQATRGSSKEAKRPANLEAINLHLDLR